VATSLKQDLATVLRIKDIWLNCLFIGLMYAPTTTFGEQWGSIFMSLNLKTSVTQGAFAVSFIFIGMACGCPLVGLISDRLGKRLPVMRWSSIACLALITLIIYQNRLNLHLSIDAIYVIMFLYGIFNSAIVPSYALSAEIVNRKVSGIALGITNMASVIIGSIFIPIVGWMVDNVKSTLSHHTALNVADFQFAFILLPICFILCFILTFYIRETHCKSVA
jgi:MFS family permease